MRSDPGRGVGDDLVEHAQASARQRGSRTGQGRPDLDRRPSSREDALVHLGADALAEVLEEPRIDATEHHALDVDEVQRRGDGHPDGVGGTTEATRARPGRAAAASRASTEASTGRPALRMSTSRPAYRSRQPGAAPAQRPVALDHGVADLAGPAAPPSGQPAGDDDGSADADLTGEVEEAAPRGSCLRPRPALTSARADRSASLPSINGMPCSAVDPREQAQHVDVVPTEVRRELHDPAPVPQQRRDGHARAGDGPPMRRAPSTIGAAEPSGLAQARSRRAAAEVAVAARLGDVVPAQVGRAHREVVDLHL